ncbi:restriction endonuclease subunit S [Campylobacter geochelonis]|uniref:Type I restriction-modification system, specificity subunit S n=1 Tax=Campylobacter geochelonis TaxID=1780362 RepID=A0A128EA19_9BACT|nr:restriction endonuclease subunit S [Campylobacter geochelonis]QKF70677.1 type I restriction/modification system, specificity subunit [Campylobacter geochelonis]CZE45805.1 Type I restriction-modification system%2C specificity subunit S [Campylobacter geochelonis]
MSWEKVKLSDLCFVITKGTTPSNIGEKFVNSGINYIRSEMLTSSKYVVGDFLHISEETHKKLKRSQLKEGDILLSMAGAYLGKTAILRSEDVPANTNQATALLRIDQKKCNNEFVYYYLNIPEVVKTINAVQSQSAQPNINLKQIGSLEINIPDEPTQEKIANILSAYDNLIENNQKQIKLLEEAAQRLYKEWFVDLHFPGYEDVPVIDGLPEGWITRSVSDFGDVITGKTPSTAKSEYYGGSIPFVTIPDMHGNVFPIKTEKYLSTQGANTQKNKFLPKNSVIVSCIATVGLVCITVEPCQTNQQINSVILNDENDLYFFYSAMKLIKSLLDGVGSNGATMTNVNKTKFSNIQVLYPTEDICKSFNDFCKPIFEIIFNLSVAINKLTQARDRLLPKLMSGELEV